MGMIPVGEACELQQLDLFFCCPGWLERLAGSKRDDQSPIWFVCCLVPAVSVGATIRELEVGQ